MEAVLILLGAVIALGVIMIDSKVAGWRKEAKQRHEELMAELRKRNR